jgi:Response regulators consisting of a CheY-like receiver domain and a winged-helix DNA-binding domain
MLCGGGYMYKIMIAEDEEKISHILAVELTKWGFEVYQVKDFNNILQEFARENPHLVLMDINLPSYDGFYWCGKIRGISKAPVVFISSRSTNMDIVMAVNMGGDDYITKPFSMEIVTAKVNAVLRRTYSYSTPNLDTIEFKGAVLSLKDNTLYFHDKPMELTKNEFRILYTLMKNNGSIISRENLMQAL